MATTNKCEAPQCLASIGVIRKFYSTAPELQATEMQAAAQRRWTALCSMSVSAGLCGAIIEAFGDVQAEKAQQGIIDNRTKTSWL